MGDLAQNVLVGYPAPDAAKADAWDAYNSSSDENDLAGKIQKIPIPDEAKANLWDAKRSEQHPEHLDELAPNDKQRITGSTSQPEKTQFEKDREHPFVPGVAGGIGHYVKNAFEDAATSSMYGPIATPGILAARAVKGIGALPEQDEELKKAGTGPKERALDAVGSMVGADPIASRQAGDVGDAGRVVGLAAAPIGAAVGGELMHAPETAGPIGEAFNKTGVPQVAGRALEAQTIGVPGERMVKNALNPGRKALSFDDDLKTATPDILRANAELPIRSVKQLYEDTPGMKDRIMTEEVNPAAKRQADSMMPPERMEVVREAVDNAPHPFAGEFDPTGTAEAQDLGDKLARARTVADMIGTSAAERGGLLGYINAHLNSYFAKYPTARGTDLMQNPDTATWEAGRRAIREQTLQHLEDLGETGVRGARLRWGALDSIERQAEKEINPGDKSRPVSQHRLAGYITGLALAPALGPLAAIASPVLGETAHYLNKPDVLLRRGIAKMADDARPVGSIPGRPGPIGEAPARAPFAYGDFVAPDDSRRAIAAGKTGPGRIGFAPQLEAGETDRMAPLTGEEHPPTVGTTPNIRQITRAVETRPEAAVSPYDVPAGRDRAPRLLPAEAVNAPREIVDGHFVFPEEAPRPALPAPGPLVTPERSGPVSTGRIEPPAGPPPREIGSPAHADFTRPAPEGSMSAADRQAAEKAAAKKPAGKAPPAPVKKTSVIEVDKPKGIAAAPKAEAKPIGETKPPTEERQAPIPETKTVIGGAMQRQAETLIARAAQFRKLGGEANLREAARLEGLAAKITGGQK